MVFRQPFIGDYPITQRYGEVIEGVTVDNKPHTGIDYGCPAGTPILASADGIVMVAEYSKHGWGNWVVILHTSNKATVYAHLSVVRVYPNQKVQQGQVIGLSGWSGNVYPAGVQGAHLHFEARHKWNDEESHFDPMLLPLNNFLDSAKTDTINLKNADEFKSGDLLKITAPLGAKAFYNTQFSEDNRTSYLPGTEFYYTGEKTVRKDNGLTYVKLVPANFHVWIAVHDKDCQILDK